MQEWDLTCSAKAVSTLAKLREGDHCWKNVGKPIVVNVCGQRPTDKIQGDFIEALNLVSFH
jgi:hypothetical protein